MLHCMQQRGKCVSVLVEYIAYVVKPLFKTKEMQSIVVAADATSESVSLTLYAKCLYRGSQVKERPGRVLWEFPWVCFEIRNIMLSHH